jgi:predicted RecB family nuclease
VRFESRTALYCPEYLHKFYAPTAFDLTARLKEGDDRLADEYKRLGNLHEDKVLAKVRACGLRVHQIDLSETYASKSQQTAEALMNHDVDIILGANIDGETEEALKPFLGDRHKTDPDRTSRPDLLIRVGADSHPIWAPVDVKSHGAWIENKSHALERMNLDMTPANEPSIEGRFHKEDALQLAHYAVHLMNLGLGFTDARAGIIGKDGEFIHWAYLDQVLLGRGKNAPSAIITYYENFKRAQDLALKSIEKDKDHSIVVDSMAKMTPGDYGCLRCEFKKVCLKEIEDYDGGNGHVTLLAGVTPTFQESYIKEIDSIADLRIASGLPEKADPAKIRARVWQTGIPELLNESEPLEIPEFDIEIDIDLENSQAALFESFEEALPGKDQVYLYGYGILDRTISKDWRSAEFKSIVNFDDTVEAEIEVLGTMWEVLNDEVKKAKAAGKTIGIFHYSKHERSWFKKFAVRHAAVPGVPSLPEVEKFMDEYFVDLLEHSKLVAFKATGYGIKKLAPLAKFDWQVDDPGGALSLLKYREAIDEKLTEEERKTHREWLRSYNIDDVKATFAVREYLRNLQDILN